MSCLTVNRQLGTTRQISSRAEKPVAGHGMQRTFVDEKGMMRYCASKLVCDVCAHKPCCCPTQPARKILRSIHEGARDLATYLVSRRERKKVEMLFAHPKRILKLDRLRLREPNGAKDKFLLAATAHILRKMVKPIPRGMIRAAAEGRKRWSPPPHSLDQAGAQRTSSHKRARSEHHLVNATEMPQRFECPSSSCRVHHYKARFRIDGSGLCHMCLSAPAPA